ncbi:MAG: hypothetical protein OEZ13_07285 [Spirochaetia bacterium]|nr:hypothetical protein [Spirochaetia bacterium]
MKLITKKNIKKEFLVNLFSELKHANIVYCVLGGYENLPEKTGNDLDIWIKPSDASSFTTILKKTARNQNWKITVPNVSPRLSSYEKKYYLINNQNVLEVIHLDCWSFLHWRGIPFVNEKKIPKFILTHSKNFQYLSPNVQIMISALKDLLYKNKIEEKRKSLIKHDFKLQRKEAALPFIKPIGKNRADYVAECLSERKWEDLEKKVSAIKIKLVFRAIFVNHIKQLYWLLKYWGGIFNLLLIKKYGLFIVFIGPDGAGKTTLAKKILSSEKFSKLYKDKYYFHSRFPFLPALRKVVELFGKNSVETKIKIEEENDYAKELAPLGLLRSMIYPIYYGINALLGYFWLFQKKRIRGGSLIVFDRYFYEYKIQKEFIRCPRILLNILEFFIPRPDVIVFAKDKAENIYLRKKELPLDEIKRQLRECEKIVKKNKKSIIINTGSSINIAAVDLEKKIAQFVR